MKRLLLLLIFSPVILLAQSQGQNVVDTSKAAADNLRRMSTAMGNDRCVKVSDIRITNNGKYSTSIVLQHTVTALDSLIPAMDTITITALNIIDISSLDIENSAALHPGSISVPIVAFIEVPDSVPITALDILATASLDTGAIPAHNIANITVPFVAFIEVPDTVTILAMDIADLAFFNTKTTNDATGNLRTVVPPILKDIRMSIENMHLSADGYSLLQKLEGYAPDLYNLGDGGYTVGFGFFVPYNESYKWSKGVSWDAAEAMIQQKVPTYEDQVKEYVNVPLTQNEFDALTMLAYNLGGFSKATSIVNDINEEVDLNKLQSDWKRFVHSKAPNVSKGLLNRRKDEIEVTKSSNYQPERKILIYKSKK